MAFVQKKFLKELIDRRRLSFQHLKETAVRVAVQQHPGQAKTVIRRASFLQKVSQLRYAEWRSSNARVDKVFEGWHRLSCFLTHLNRQVCLEQQIGRKVIPLQCRYVLLTKGDSSLEFTSPMK